MESIIAAIIAAVLTASASVYAARLSNEKTVAVLTERLDNYRKSTDNKIESLSDHVEKHNGLVERMIKLEMETGTQWRRIDELQKSVDSINGKRVYDKGEK